MKGRDFFFIILTIYPYGVYYGGGAKSDTKYLFYSFENEFVIRKVDKI